MTTQDDRRYADALAAYRRRVTAPPAAEVRRRVMAELAAAPRGASQRAVWRWFVRPQTVRIRPLLAAAVILVMVGLSVSTGRLLFDAPPPAPSLATVLVRFEVEVPGARTVELVGSFNNWGEGTALATPTVDRGVWAVTIPLPPGRHEYMFVVDGERWIPDPKAHATVDDGFGSLNSLIVVGPRGVVRS